jgi:hypothetical protein
MPSAFPARGTAVISSRYIGCDSSRFTRVNEQKPDGRENRTRNLSPSIHALPSPRLGLNGSKRKGDRASEQPSRITRQRTPAPPEAMEAECGELVSEGRAPHTETRVISGGAVVGE